MPKRYMQVAVGYCSSNLLLPLIFTHMKSAELRKILFLPASEHESQLNQDLFALLVNRFKQGYFLEIGANDGFTLSNTAYLEEHFGWHGLLVEANPKYASSLAKRRARTVLVAVADTEGEHDFVDAGLLGGITKTIDSLHVERRKNSHHISVQGMRLERLLVDKDAPKLIHFVSVDVEGAELDIVRQMCGLHGHRFVCGCIEHNGREQDYREISRLLHSAGYQVVWNSQTSHDLYFIDREHLNSIQ